MALANSPIPTIDVIPPLSSKARDLLYGVLSWGAGLLTILSAIILIVPEWDLSRPLAIANIVVNGLWTLGGFKAKNNVTPAVDVQGKHEAA